MELELKFRGGGQAADSTSVGPGEYVLGRDPACELVLNGDAVSRRHARLTVGVAELFIEDLGSANGTFVDGKPVVGRTGLTPGQLVLLGQVAVEMRRRPMPT